jgi:hypothetical protein
MSTRISPELPVGIEWITKATDATDTVAKGVIPLLQPSSTDRAHRWARVLHAYGDIPTPVPLETQASGRRVLISVGDTEAVGEAAAMALGRTHCHVADTTSASAIDVSTCASIMLVAIAADCTFVSLHPLLRAWEREGIPFGVLTGLDEAGMFFALAKILADRHAAAPRSSTDVRIDGTTGTAKTATAQQPQLAEALTVSWRHMVIDAHGTDSHVIIGSFVLCGLSGDQENWHDGTPLPGGCTNGRCRAGREVLEPVLVRDLRCRTLALFVCNAITLAPVEQFPSDVTLALAALEGFPAAIIGLLRQDAETEATESATAMHLLSSGASAGTMTSWLSQDAASRGHPSAYLLLGDPDHGQSGTKPAVAPTPWPQGRQPVLPAVQDSTGRPVSALHTRDGVVAPRDVAGPLRIWDAANAVDDMVTQLALWIVDCDEAAHLEDALQALTSSTSKRRSVLTACLDRMREHRRETRRLALQGIRAAQTYRRTRRGAPPEPPLAALREHAMHWAAALHDTVIARAGAFRLWEALEVNHLACQAEPHTPCGRCETPRTRTDLLSPVIGQDDRVSITCPRCGPSTHYPAFQPLEARSPATLEPGGTAEIAVTIPPCAHDAADIGLLAVQIQDRAALVAIAQQACTARPGEEHNMPLSVPTDLGPDLHRIWTLWVHRFRVSLLQLRIPTAHREDAS